ncbi:MAG: hypothetical protein K0U36_06090 [Alphaproteobacteria bacterium]|nr:hypothetical protein [Alphaproteobacteria bacterium]
MVNQHSTPSQEAPNALAHDTLTGLLPDEGASTPDSRDTGTSSNESVSEGTLNADAKTESTHWMGATLASLRSLSALLQQENRHIQAGQYLEATKTFAQKQESMNSYGDLVVHTKEQLPHLSENQRQSLHDQVQEFHQLCAENEVLLRVALDISSKVLGSLSFAARKMAVENAPYTCRAAGGRFGGIIRPALRKGVTAAGFVEQVC